MQYTHDDAGLLAQPIGYWSWAAHESVVGYIRRGLATVGLTQPQWWVLNQLGEDDSGKNRVALTQLLQGYLGVGDQLQIDIDDLIERALVVDDHGQLTMTDDPCPDHRPKCDRSELETPQTRHTSIPDPSRRSEGWCFRSSADSSSRGTNPSAALLPRAPSPRRDQAAMATMASAIIAPLRATCHHDRGRVDHAPKHAHGG